MIVLDTLRVLHEHEHQLAAYYPTCERWAVLDLGKLIAEGRDLLLRRPQASLQLLRTGLETHRRRAARHGMRY